MLRVSSDLETDRRQQSTTSARIQATSVSPFAMRKDRSMGHSRECLRNTDDFWEMVRMAERNTP
jgi:hypothetical protein